MLIVIKYREIHDKVATAVIHTIKHGGAPAHPDSSRAFISSNHQEDGVFVSERT